MGRGLVSIARYCESVIGDGCQLSLIGADVICN